MLTKKLKLTAPKYQPHLSPGKVPYREQDRPGTKLQSEKRKQLESILQTEKVKEERGKLGCILIDRLIKKFGSKHSALITFFVEEFLSSHSNIGKDEINSLEKEIGNALDMKATNRPMSGSLFGNTSSKKNHNGNEANLNGNNREENNQQQPVRSAQSSLPDIELSRPPSGKEWEVINSYQLLKGEEQERRERELQRKKKLDFKKSLDNHIQIAQTVKNSSNMSDADYVSGITMDIEKYHNEEKSKFDRIKKHNHDESDLRMAQIIEKQRRLAKEKEDALEADRRNQEINLLKQKEEQEKIARIRREKLEAQERIQKENQENERLRALQRQHEAEEDQRQMQEYAAKLDREAMERENAFKKRMEESAKNGQLFATEGAGKALREAKIREEQLLIKEQLRKEEADLAKEMKKKEDQRMRTHMQLLENERQIEQKRKESADRNRSDGTFAQLARREAEANTAAERERQRLRLIKQAEYKALLDKQVAEAQNNRQKVVSMAPAEKDINMPTLREATEDPQMLSRVMHRMRLTKASQQSLPKASKAPF